MSWWIVVLVCWAASNAGFVCGCWWRSRRGESLADRIAPYSVGVSGTTATVTWAWPDSPGSASYVASYPTPPTRPPLAAVADPPRRLQAVK